MAGVSTVVSARNLVRRIYLALMHERPGRRRLGLLLAVSLFLTCVAIQAMWWNPLGLLVLEPVSRETVVWVIYAAGAAAAVATTLVGLRRKLAVALSALVVMFSLLVTGVVALNRHLYSDAEPGFEAVATAVAAGTDDGRFEVVTTTYRGDEDADFWYEEWHVESRAGLLSRRGDFFIAVLDHPLDDPGIRMESVTFKGDRAVEMRTSDGRQWTVAFDPGSMRVSHWLRSCDEEGGLCWNPLS